MQQKALEAHLAACLCATEWLRAGWPLQDGWPLEALWGTTGALSVGNVIPTLIPNIISLNIVPTLNVNCQSQKHILALVSNSIFSLNY